MFTTLAEKLEPINHVGSLFIGDNKKITYMYDLEDIIKSNQHFGCVPLDLHVAIHAPLVPGCHIATYGQLTQGGWRVGVYEYDGKTHDLVEGNTTYPFTTADYFLRVVGSTSHKLRNEFGMTNIHPDLLKEYSFAEEPKPDIIHVGVVETFVNYRLIKRLIVESGFLKLIY